MKNTVKFLLISVLVLTANIAFAQVVKLKTTQGSVKVKTDGAWGEWSEWKDLSVLTVFNFDKKRITIYSKEVQVYDIITTYEKVADDDGDETIKFECVDNDGEICYVRFVILKSQNNKLQVYIDFDKIKLAYNVYGLD